MSYIHHLEHQLEDEAREGQEIGTPTLQSSPDETSHSDNNMAQSNYSCNSNNDQVDSPKVNIKK